jgi:DNA-directed RNA polymerase specialized sigma24 family protein
MTTKTARTGRYRRDEVEALVEGYEELREQRDVDRKRRLRIVHGLLDLRSALPMLTTKERQAIFLMGQLGFTERQAAEILRLDNPATMWRRYQYALTRLTEIMSRGGT